MAPSLGLDGKENNILQRINKRGLILNELTKEEKEVILDKGTEKPFTGKFTTYEAKGFYTCKQCDAKLYSSSAKFDSHCGWPSFDDELFGAVKRQADADGRRIEIVCANCGGHLGHVFKGEGLTAKNIRHCVNSISMKFIPADQVKLGRAIFAGGCFWGVEYYLQQVSGVLETTVGYIGGILENPTYEDICRKNTGHAEAVEIIFDRGLVDFETLAQLFFEIHDPAQADGQGPDLGDQYRSEIFVIDQYQREVVEKLITRLKDKKYAVTTKVTAASKFWVGESVHQDYYYKKGATPYCHAYHKKFD